MGTRYKQVTARTTVGGECHVICTLTRTVFDDGSIYDKLDGRQTIVCYYFSLRLLKVLVISVHIQSVLRWFIPPWQSHDKQTICQASRPYLVFASHSWQRLRDEGCVIEWESSAGRASRVIYRTEKMGKVNPILFISIRALQTLSDFVSLLNFPWGGGNLPHLLLL